MVTLEELLRIMVERGGSDLHITANSPPRIRIHGRLIPTEHDVLDAEATQRLVYSILNNEQIAKFERDLELDMSFGITGLGRFRTNCFYQRGAVGCVIRVFPERIRTIEELGLPVDLCKELCHLPKGLILVTGATGSGKSTTLAAMIDYINSTRQEHIVTIEDPIEFVHKNKRCLVNQREVGTDTKSFHNALRAVLRQDPDIVLVGEMRDQETIETALTIAETGHLTFGTLHTSDAVQTINRIIDVFPAYAQPQVRTQLSFVLQAVFCQQLIPRADGKGRVLAAEILRCTSAVRSLIREDRAHQVYSLMQTGAKYGMQTMNQSLFNLYQRGLVTLEEILQRSTDPAELQKMVEKAGKK